MLDAAADKFVALGTHWLRVGFVQGNFNSDNCLVGGRTMDYGPFGFMERYEALWNMWTGGGEHFAYINQLKAAGKNFETLVNSVVPLLENQEQRAEAKRLVADFDRRAAVAEHNMWCAKLGIPASRTDSKEARLLHQSVLPLMERSQADFTIFWREMGYLARDYEAGSSLSSDALESMDIFYQPLNESLKGEWTTWLQQWKQMVLTDTADSKQAIQSMLQVNPKYVPREWMLIDAYTHAAQGNYAPTLRLQELFLNPYAEQPAFEADFYHRAPEGTYSGIGRAGQTFMS
jgi:uncharacterized protein YdiU (UPF0061 family)